MADSRLKSGHIVLIGAVILVTLTLSLAFLPKDNSLAPVEKKLDWKYDGAVPDFSCSWIHGEDTTTIGGDRVCKYEDKTLKILSDLGIGCPDAMTSWIDPETGKEYTFPGICGFPVFCSDSGSSTSGYSYPTSSIYYHGSLGFDSQRSTIHLNLDGDICYSTSTVTYIKDPETVKFTVKGVWNSAVAKITYDTHMFGSDPAVWFNNEKVEFSYEEVPKYRSPGRFLGVITLDIPQSTEAQEIIVTDKGFLG